MNLSASRLMWRALRKVQARRSSPSGVVPVALANENAVGIELLGPLNMRNLLILRSGKREKNRKNAKQRYTRGTRGHHRWASL